MKNKERKNLTKLVHALQCRLQSKGKAKSVDGYGNTIYIDCDVYSLDLLETFIHLSISGFNQVPYFTFFSLEDTKFVDTFTEVLVEGATLYALASQALIERGREFQIVDTSIAFTPPSVSEMLNTQYCTLLNLHHEKLILIKQSIGDFDK